MNGHDTNSHDDRNDHGKKRKRLAFLIARQDGNGVAVLIAWTGIERGAPARCPDTETYTSFLFPIALVPYSAPL